MRVIVLVPWLAACAIPFPLEDKPPAPLGKCSRADSFVDDFDADVLSPVWKTSVSSIQNSVVVGDGAVTSDLMAINTEALIESVAHFDFRGATFSVEATGSGNIGPGFDNFASLELMFPGFSWSTNGAVVTGDSLVLRRRDANMEVGQYIDGVFSTVRNVEFPETPKIWKISHDGTEVIFEVSVDGAEFQELQRLAIPIGMMRPRLYARQLNGGPFQVRFDNYNGTEATTEVCATSELVDGFDDELDPNLWSDSKNNGCQLVVEGGALVMSTPAADFETDCFIRTGALFDLYRSGITVELDASALIAGHNTRLQVRTLTDTVELVVVAASGNILTLEARGSVSPSPYRTLAYDPAAQRWLRMRAELTAQGDEQIYWEASPDGLEFTVLAQTGDYLGLDRAQFQIGSDGAQSPIGRVEVFGVNVPPGE